MSEIVEVDPTGVSVDLDVAAATRLDTRIRLMAGTVRDNLIKLGELVDEAKTGQIHVALGFASWTAYLADALGGQLDLDTGSRRAVVELLAGEGMSQRAIATAVGVSQKTVDRDLDHVSHGDSREPVTGLDGKCYFPRLTRELDPPPEPDPEPEPEADDEFINAVLEYGAALRAAEQSGEHQDEETGTVERRDPKKLWTWCGGKSHEFDSWDDVYAAISANIAGVSSMIGTIGSQCYRTRSGVKIPVDEADFMAEQLKDLQVALLVLLEHRPTGGEILAQSDELDHRATEIVADLFTAAPAEQIEEEPDDEDGYTLWSPDVTITVTSRTDYEDLKPWALSLYRALAPLEPDPPNREAYERFSVCCGGFWRVQLDGDDVKWVHHTDSDSIDVFNVFAATLPHLDPLILIANMARWLEDESGIDAITTNLDLIQMYQHWDGETMKEMRLSAGQDGKK